jgi:hypothetical protein
MRSLARLSNFIFTDLLLVLLRCRCVSFYRCSAAERSRRCAERISSAVNMSQRAAERTENRESNAAGSASSAGSDYSDDDDYGQRSRSNWIAREKWLRN